ncbi:hypothetical protein FBU30_002165 [Linnemannia zychae]|nr:hypothetical protein FBU30_002165 [Linnemannia zychae]
MARPSYFETGTHHVLCKIASLDPKEFPYPNDFQDCWDHHHVRLACSDRPLHAAVPNAWPEIVKGLTTTINNSKQLSEILSRWNEGDPQAWNIDALEAFLNNRANRETSTRSATSTPTSTSSSGHLFQHKNTKEVPIDKDSDSDIIMNDSSNREDESHSPPTASNSDSPFLRWDHNEETAKDQFLSREERDRFFNFILPGMQNLALRLPELVKRPIPFLKQQQDSAITLSQEQVEPSSSSRPKSSQTQPPAVTSRHFDKDADKTKDRVPLRNQSTHSVPRRTTSSSGGGGASVIPVESHKSEHRSKEQRPTTAREQKRPPFPRYPSINFSSLFQSNDIRNPCTSTNAAKLRCIIHYFDRILQQMPNGVVTFHRQVLNGAITLEPNEMLNKTPFRYSNVRVELDAPLEDDAPLGALQLDFANKVIGGGVLNRGAVQEEIRFAICPELIISRLFTQTLQDNEALLIKGAERFSNYNGYAQTFEWHSDFVDTTPRDKLGRRKTEICAIDALPFKSHTQRLEQFCESALLRELNKAIVGFRRSPITSSEWGLCRGEVPSPRGALIATGNWGCGAFGGHLQLKFLIQLIAASICAGYSSLEDMDDLGRDIIYFTYGLDDLADEIKTFIENLKAFSQILEPWQLLDCIVHYPIKSSRGDIVSLRSNKSLLDYISAALGFPTTSHKDDPSLSSSVFDTQSSTFDTWSLEYDESYLTPKPESLSD